MQCSTCGRSFNEDRIEKHGMSSQMSVSMDEVNKSNEFMKEEKEEGEKIGTK